MHVILYRANNSPSKFDAQGAFVPEANALEHLLKERREGVFCRGLIMPDRSTALRVLEEQALIGFKTLSFFCHGFRNGIEVIPRTKEHAIILAELIIEAGCELVNFFACSTAKRERGNQSWCQMVSDALRTRGHECVIMGHDTAGHTSWNPNVSIFEVKKEGVFERRALVLCRDFPSFSERMKKDQDFRLLLTFDELWPEEFGRQKNG